jgi:hypothetical protein
MKSMTLIVALSSIAGCAQAELGDRKDLSWVSPDPSAEVYADEPLQLAVASGRADAKVVRFSIDGAEVASCDSQLADADCRVGALWRWTANLGEGSHQLSAVLDDGTEVTEHVTVRPASAKPALSIEPAVAGRGTLDPDHAFHSVFGGIQWAMTAQRVILHSGTPAGGADPIRACMARYGTSIRTWADHYQISRASVVATAITESNCTNPAGSSDRLSSGPMQVTGSTCAALMGISSSTCKTRMHSSPDFSFQVGAKYMATSGQRAQHHGDPPKIAAAYNAGSVRRSSANRWHMVTTGNHIDRFVTAYNGYRAWEISVGAAATTDAGAVEVTWSGEHVNSATELPALAAEGTSVFVGDFDNRDGDFYTYLGGRWQSPAQP